MASPTDGGLYMAGIAVDVDKVREFHADREHNFVEGLARWPELADLLAGAQREGPIRVMTDWHGYFRRSAGPGWVLVGDAGHFKDFTPAQGIADALRQAQRLAASITGGLDQDGELDARLRRRWQWRDEDAYDMYWLAKDMGVPGVSTPLITSVIREIAGSEAA
ncbi:MAG: NAD(P)/FAD-dependent oxidoreductase, partial [Mycobacterium sp.]